MKSMFIVLNKTEKLNELLRCFSEHKIYGGTILESQGMAASLIQSGDTSGIYLRLNSLLNQGRPFNKTLMMVLRDEQVTTVRQCIDEVLGDMHKHNMGIVFTVPVDDWDGIVKED